MLTFGGIPNSSSAGRRALSYDVAPTGLGSFGWKLLDGNESWLLNAMASEGV